MRARERGDWISWYISIWHLVQRPRRGLLSASHCRCVLSGARRARALSSAPVATRLRVLALWMCRGFITRPRNRVPKASPRRIFVFEPTGSGDKARVQEPKCVVSQPVFLLCPRPAAFPPSTQCVPLIIGNEFFLPGFQIPRRHWNHESRLKLGYAIAVQKSVAQSRHGHREKPLFRAHRRHAL